MFGYGDKFLPKVFRASGPEKLNEYSQNPMSITLRFCQCHNKALSVSCQRQNLFLNSSILKKQPLYMLGFFYSETPNFILKKD